MSNTIYRHTHDLYRDYCVHYNVQKIWICPISRTIFDQRQGVRFRKGIFRIRQGVGKIFLDFRARSEIQATNLRSLRIGAGLSRFAFLPYQIIV